MTITGNQWTEPGLLSQLSGLDRSLLHVFVAGPGQGEGLAVALPDRGWIIIDGCQVPGDRLPLWEIFVRYRSDDQDPIVGIILTHPHRDHVLGLPEFLERMTPEWVAFTGDEPALLSDEAARWRALKVQLAGHHAEARTVAGVLQRILDWGGEHPGRLIAAHDGTTLPLGHAEVRATVLAPTVGFVQAFFADPARVTNLSRGANDLSMVLQVSFGATLLILAGDLPDRRGDGRVFPHGMSHVLARNPVGLHHGLKLAHHGSWMATCEPLMARSASPGCWWVTPFNSHGLPDLTHERGLPMVLSFQPEIHQTALSTSAYRQLSRPIQPLTLRQLRDATRLAEDSTSDAFRAGAQEVTLLPCDALDPVWCCAFDNTGHLRGRWRGDCAFLVRADP